MALYRAKAEGRGRYAFYEPGMNAAAELSRKLDVELREALGRGRLRLLYQYQIGLADGSLVGLEALARWPREDGALLAAETFIPVAESTGLIRPLGQWVLREVCRQASRWRLWRQRTPIAVNIAASQLRAERFVDDLLALLAECRLPGSALQLELGEAVLTEPALAAMGDEVMRLQEAGVAIVLDEFGRGPLALARLSGLRLAAVKLDRMLVAGIGRDVGAERVLSAATAAARSLGLRVSAAGVETAAQAAFLSACGCDTAQGFLFGPPLPAEALDAPALAGHG
jgi:EAL domain-containing protein (putative c-di-GMP-specific phosphodiesterase class I)